MQLPTIDWPLAESDVHYAQDRLEHVAAFISPKTRQWFDDLSAEQIHLAERMHERGQGPLGPWTDAMDAYRRLKDVILDINADMRPVPVRARFNSFYSELEARGE